MLCVKYSILPVCQKIADINSVNAKIVSVSFLLFFITTTPIVSARSTDAIPATDCVAMRATVIMVIGIYERFHIAMTRSGAMKRAREFGTS